MSFADFVARIWDKKPVWLYRIEIPGSVFLLTSRAQDWVTPANKPDATFASGATFAWSPIDRGEIVDTLEGNRERAWVSLPTSHAAIQAIMDYDEWSEISVTIWQTYIGDPDEEYLAMFSGRVTAPEFGTVVSRLILESDMTSMGWPSAAQVVQKECRHTHYFTEDDGTGCTLDIEAFYQNADVTAADGVNLTIPLASAQPDGRFMLGILRYGGKEYLIRRHEGDQITVARTVTGLETALGGGDVPVELAPGCDGTLAACNNVFSNTINFGGLPWISESPFDGRSIV